MAAETMHKPAFYLASRTCVMAAMLFIAACAPAVRGPTSPALELDVPAQFPLKDYQAQSLAAPGKVLRVNAAQSDVRILVYRGGELVRFGHNHVVTSADVRGYVLRADDILESRFDLFLPVDRLIVDDPAVRAAEGAEFSSAVSEQDAQGTRANMLGEKVLDAGQFPFLHLGGDIAGSNETDLALNVAIKLRDVTQSLQTVAQLTENKDGLVIEGGFSILQTDFGIEPFSALLGRLRVKDELQIKYRIVATASVP